MRLSHFILISVFIHLGTVWVLQPRPIDFQDLHQEIELLEVVKPTGLSNRTRKVTSANPAQETKPVSPPTVTKDHQTPLKEELDAASESSANGQEGSTEPFSLGAVTEAPRVIREKKVPYPKKAARDGIEGVVEMRLVINAQGAVEQAEVIKGPAPSLNEAALAAIKEFLFSPAKVGDKSVPVRLIYKYRFGSGGSS